LKKYKKLMASEAATQHAALCYRPTTTGQCEILLITSRDTGRWVLPKGWPKKNEPGGETAMREAYEEAGVKGKLMKGCVGVFDYDKVLSPGSAIPCCVAVHAIKTTHMDDDFPEKDERTRAWFTPREAAKAVAEPELQRLLESFTPEG
jgi:8-oxo-dGTP pyrophosphatase MutT (NUDIX family)